jgi:predicted permease
MRLLLWHVIEWHLRRHLTPEQLDWILDDLAEELKHQNRSRGPAAGSLWLVREALSLSRAYRGHARRDSRASRRAAMGETWLQDARFAVRRLGKRPGASLASIGTLACAIAAAAVTWSVLSALLLNPLPVRSAEDVFVVGSRIRASGAGPAYVSETQVYTVHQAIRESGTFEAVAATGTMSLLVNDPGATVSRQRPIAFVSHDFFDLLGISPAIGRDFGPDDDRRGLPPTAMVSHRYWRTVLAGDPNVIGRIITITGRPATVIGVAPRRFPGLDLAQPPDLYLPLFGVTSLDAKMVYSNPLNDPQGTTPTSWVKTVGRLRSDSDAAEVLQVLQSLPAGMRRGDVLELIPINTTVIPLPARETMRNFASLLAATVGLLLLIGCLTAGVLLLVRTEARRNEIAICLAIGGTRWSLARGIVIEGAIVAFAGVAVALPLAWWLSLAVRAFQLPGPIDLNLLELTIDRTSWLPLAASGAIATLLIGMVAAAFGWAPQDSVLLQSRISATPRVTRRTRSALVILQVAVAFVLVAGAGQLIRSLTAALSLNSGFNAALVITGDVSLREHNYSDERAGQFFDDLRERLSNNPSVEAISLAQWQGAMTPRGQIVVDGQPKQFPTTVRYIAVDERYFSTLGLATVAGRTFTREDTMDSPLVAVVSEGFARLVADGGDPFKHTFADSYTRKDVRIVGVVRDAILNVAELEPLTIYYSLAQQGPRARRTLIIRAAGDPAMAVREATATISSLDSRVAPAPLLTIRQRLAQQMGAQRLGSLVLGVLGSIAVLLTLLGTYVLADATSTMRRREFGIRAALGATRAALRSLVLKETLKLVGGGLVLGLFLAWLGSGLIRAFMFRVEAVDPQNLLGTSISILLLALVVSLRPALDAARPDLTQTLRDE